MNAHVKYRMAFILHPFNDKMRADCVSAWCLIREVIRVQGGRREVIDSKPVALFNLDSEAETFQRFLLDGVGITVDEDFKEREREREELRQSQEPR